MQLKLTRAGAEPLFCYIIRRPLALNLQMKGSLKNKDTNNAESHDPRPRIQLTAKTEIMSSKYGSYNAAVS